MGFVEPTPIQLRAFPIVLAGKDLIGTAQTGTGKTAAFALPILTLLAKHGAFRCLVLEPTRELARSEEHTSELQSRSDLVCRLLLEKKKKKKKKTTRPY